MDMQKKQLAKEIDKVIANGFNIDSSNDEEVLKNSDYKWEDLNQLKEDLANKIIEFMVEVNSAITNPLVINNLGTQAPHFNKLIELFYSDINNFSTKVKDIRVQHEDKSGPIKDINDFDVYNRLAIQYQSLFSELATLITPTLSEMMITIADIVPNTGPVTIDQPAEGSGN